MKLFDFNADPNPALHSNADPDPSSKTSQTLSFVLEKPVKNEVQKPWNVLQADRNYGYVLAVFESIPMC